MKAIIENYPIEELRKEFDMLLFHILQSKDEKELRDTISKLKNQFNFDFLIYGFGSGHFWASTKETGLRIIFVQF